MKIFIVILLSLTTQIIFSQNIITLKSQRNKDNSVNIQYTKNKPGSYHVYLNFTRYENMLLPQKRFIIKGSEGFLLKLRPINNQKPISYSYTYTYKREIPNSKVDTSFIYLLPFKNNTSIKVNHLNNLEAKYFDEEEPKNWKAFQFLSNKPDTICSVRKGVIVNVIDNYSIDTTHTYSFSSRRNAILIEHLDGTFARYQGLDGEKIFIKEGDIVLPNQPLGILTQYDKKEIYQLRFSIFYITENPLENHKNNEKSSAEYLDPYFQTTEDILKLSPRNKFTTKVTEDILIKELSKRELKNKKENQ